MNRKSVSFLIRSAHFSFVFFLLLLLAAFTYRGISPHKLMPDPPSIEGRWDITVFDDGKEFPSWLEVSHSGIRTLVGRFVGISGSARPISKVNFVDGKLSFSIPPQWEDSDKDLTVEGTLEGDALNGTMNTSDGKTLKWKGVRAPLLKREKAPTWGNSIKIFNGKDLKGWKASGENQWKVESGILTNPKAGSNLITEQTFNDFKLHFEFRYPKGSNSGMYLRGRYEVQIIDSKGMQPASGLFAGVYGFLTPSEMAAKEPGEWQTYDITLVGRMINIVANGKTVICNQEIPGITGGALNSNEGEAGPLMIQGDHGPVEFRSIVITPAK